MLYPNGSGVASGKLYSKNTISAKFPVLKNIVLISSYMVAYYPDILSVKLNSD